MLAAFFLYVSLGGLILVILWLWFGGESIFKARRWL